MVIRFPNDYFCKINYSKECPLLKYLFNKKIVTFSMVLASNK